MMNTRNAPKRAARMPAAAPDVDPLALDPQAVPAPTRSVPMPGVEIVPISHPGGRTDTRTARTRDGHLRWV